MKNAKRTLGRGRLVYDQAMTDAALSAGMDMADTCIGLIGFGAIGRDVVAAMSKRATPPTFVVLRRSSSEEARTRAGLRQVSDIASLLAMKPDLVVEAAGHEALEALVPLVLEAGVSVVAASAGSLVQTEGDGTLAQRLIACGRPHGARLIVPAGAIGGLDYLAAVAGLPDLRVSYTSRKPPGAWREELEQKGLWQAAQAGEIALFSGSVEEAAKLYPRNLNVAATIALAIGRCDGVSVRVVVDPAAAGNTHEIEVESAAGRARFEFINAPSPTNPKTSLVTALSVIQSIDAFLDARRTAGA
ncbi:MAG: aspartate dehydrogenase [Beijerinckiaceae bacterium]|nr:aspartate dehydrogenase [Beijerinckiaceae bacterium]